jgi:hypothetical protein
VEALSKINQSQTALIAKVERGLSESLKEVTKSLHNLQSEFSASKTTNIKQNSDVNITKLQAHVTDISNAHRKIQFCSGNFKIRIISVN